MSFAKISLPAFLYILCFNICVLGLFMATAPQAQAYDYCYGCCACVVEQAAHSQTRETINKEYVEKDFFEDFRENFILNELARDYWTDALQFMTEQISAGQMSQAETGASFADDVRQNNVQNAASRQLADVTEEMRVSDELCTRQTVSGGLAGTQGRTRAAEEILSSAGVAADLNVPGSIGGRGPGVASEQRRIQALSTYMSGDDMGGSVGEATGITPVDGRRINADLFPSYFTNETFPVDYTDDANSDTETDLMAFRDNLYTAEGLSNLPPVVLQNPQGQGILREINDLAAIQSLSRKSFDSYVALHQEGSNEAGQYIRAVLNENGVNDEAAVERIMGPNDHPSFMGQMKALAKYLNQNPASATGYISSPADLERKTVLQETVALMLKFETYMSLKRSAAHWVQLNELKLRDATVDYVTSTGRLEYSQD